MLSPTTWTPINWRRFIRADFTDSLRIFEYFCWKSSSISLTFWSTSDITSGLLQNWHWFPQPLRMLLDSPLCCFAADKGFFIINRLPLGTNTSTERWYSTGAAAWLVCASPRALGSQMTSSGGSPQAATSSGYSDVTHADKYASSLSCLSPRTETSNCACRAPTSKFVARAAWF